MKFKYFFTLVLFPVFLIGQSEKEIKSEIQDVTVFTTGAQVSRSAKVTLARGVNYLVFRDLSPVLDEKSLQFKADGDLTILSLNFDIRFDEALQARRDKAVSLNKQLGDLADQVRTKKDLLAVSVQEEQVLLSNTDFDIWKDMSVTQLQQGVDFVRNRMTEIRQRKQRLENEIDDINAQRQKVVNQLQELRIQDAKPFGAMVVRLKSDMARTVDADISYVVADAGWEPYYDFRVEDVSKPLQIAYKAKVHQNTGEDWESVNLTLSTGNPYEAGRLPELNPWYLNFINSSYYQQSRPTPAPQRQGKVGTFRGLVTDAQTGEAIPFANVVALDQQGSVVNGVASDVDGNFQLKVDQPAQRLEVSFIGYNKYSTTITDASKFYQVKLIENSSSLNDVVVTYDKPLTQRSSRAVQGSDVTQMAVRDIGQVRSQTEPSFGSGGTFRNERYASKPAALQEFKISRNQVNLKFEIDQAYDIPSDGEQYKVAVKEYEKEANYLYRAVPKLNEHAFLTAAFTDWEDLNLMNGSAGIYYEDTYLGETYLNVEEAGDTLKVSLGKDENIVVLRKSLSQKESKNFFGSKKEEHFHYEIKVRNNKPTALKLEIIDQFPVSGNDEISVERVESSEGEVEDKTGIITWEFELEPKEEKKIDLIYKVRYPKDRMINIR